MISDLEKLKENISKEINKNPNLITNDVKNILEEYSGEDWKDYIEVSEEKYKKKNIFTEEKFDIHIITWNKYQKSKVHDHSQNGCIYKILMGNITERVYNAESLKKISLSQLSEGCLGNISNNNGYHSMDNNNNHICVSIHIYSPPNYKTNYF